MKTKILAFLLALAIVPWASAAVVVYNSATGQILEIGDADASRFKGVKNIVIADLKTVNLGDLAGNDLKDLYFSTATNRITVQPAAQIDTRKGAEQLQVDVRALANLRMNLFILNQLATETSRAGLLAAIQKATASVTAEISAIFQKY